MAEKPEQIDWKAKHDAVEKKLKALMAVRVDYDASFAKFWAAYPKKQAKPTAYKAWCRLHMTRELYTEIMVSLGKHKLCKQWLKGEGQFIPMPSTWITQERWKDEVVPQYPSGMSSTDVVRKCEHCDTLGDGRNEIRDVDGVLWCRYCYNVCGDGCGKKCRRDRKGEK